MHAIPITKYKDIEKFMSINIFIFRDFNKYIRLKNIYGEVGKQNDSGVLYIYADM